MAGSQVWSVRRVIKNVPFELIKKHLRFSSTVATNVVLTVKVWCWNFLSSNKSYYRTKLAFGGFLYRCIQVFRLYQENGRKNETHADAPGFWLIQRSLWCGNGVASLAISRATLQWYSFSELDKFNDIYIELMLILLCILFIFYSEKIIFYYKSPL